MRNKIIISIIILFIIIGGVVFINFNKITRPDNECIASIYHSEMLGMDAGTEYVYYIYPDENDTYIYIKSRGIITIAGLSDTKDIASGKITKVADFEKITKDIEKDKREGSQCYITYSYINGENVEKYETMSEFIDRLF